MSFYVFYPPTGGGSVSNPSIGLNGDPAPTSSTQIAGQDAGGDLVPVLVTSGGAVVTSPDPAGVQHVIVDSSALPTGASTAANQATANASLSSIDTKLTAPLSVTGPLTDTQLRATPVPVSAASLPLPTGASTSALQTTGNTSLSSIDGKVPSGLTVSSTRLLVDGSGATQPVSGTVTVTQATGTNLHTVVDSSALPTGAATESTLSTLNGKVPSGLTVTSTRLLVDASGTTQPISGSVTVANASGASAVNIQDGGNSITVDGTVAATQSGTWNINNVSGTVSLPTGAATETTLAAINTKTPALGQATSANSRPVVIASDQSNLPENLTQIAGNTVSTAQGVPGTGTLRVMPANQSSATLANVTSSASSVTLLASSATRMGATIWNDSTQILYVKFGATASTTSYTVRLVAGAYYELPQPCYSGVIDGIWASANGAARVTSW